MLTLFVPFLTFQIETPNSAALQKETAREVVSVWYQSCGQIPLHPPNPVNFDFSHFRLPRTIATGVLKREGSST